MRNFKRSITISSCLLTLLPGLVFANDLHTMIPNPNTNPGAATAAPGQTGSNVLASCGATTFFSIGAGAKTSSGGGSPFNPSATKKYAGNPGSPATNPNAVSQYDNACAQAALHSPP
jgi:hypothetical protein